MSQHLNQPSVLLAATATGTAGAIVFALLPILAGQIADQFVLDDAQLGLVSSAYFSIYAIVALSAPLWIRSYNWRRIALAGFVTLLAGLTLLLQSSSGTVVAVAMAIAGAGAAVLLPISLALVGDMNNNDRAYGIVVAQQQLVPTLLLLGISAAWFGQYHLTNTVLLIGGVVVLMLFLSFALPTQGAPQDTSVAAKATKAKPTPVSTRARSLPAIVGLIGLALNFAGFAAMWTFLERIAAQSNLEAGFTARWIAIGLLMTAIGPLIAAALGGRVARVIPLALPTVVAICSLLLLSGAETPITPGTFAWVLVLFPLSYYITLSFILGVIADADPNGRVQSLMSFALACGALVGPGVFGVLRASDSDTALTLIACALGSGVVLILWVERNTRLNTGS